MSIDVKEWAAKREAIRKRHEVSWCHSDLTDFFGELMSLEGDYIRAVIADETPNIVKAVLNTPIEQTTVNLDGKTICTYPVVPEGDVPEWCYDVAIHWLDRVQMWNNIGQDKPTLAKCIHDAAESELTRRVAEATADKDRRIAELEAECERLNILIQATAEAWLSLEPGVAWEGAIDAAMKAGVGEIQKLRQQLAEATRPVEGVEELVELTCKESFVSFDAVSWLSVKSLMANAAKKAIQRERAARLAAEAERDELRAAWKRRFACVETDGNGLSRWSTELRDSPTRPEGDPSDAVLAAYRAEKGKVTG